MSAVAIVAIVGWAVALWAICAALVERSHARKLEKLLDEAMDVADRSIKSCAYALTRWLEAQDRTETYDIDRGQL